MIWQKSFVVATILLILLGISVALYLPAIASAADKPQSSGKINEQRLTGRWVRLDGGYILELNDISKDGSLKAAYLIRSLLRSLRRNGSVRKVSSTYLSSYVMSTTQGQNTI